MAETMETLTRRIEALEDQVAVRDALARYCLAADSGDAKAAATLFVDNCNVDIDGAVFMKSKKEVHASMDSAGAKAMVPNGAHITGPFVVQITGNKAVATGYMTVFLKGDAIVPARQSLGLWELEKQNGTWLIVNRVARSTGRDDTKNLSAALRA